VKGALVEEFFQDTYLKFRSNIIQALRETMTSKDQTVVVTGHSLGGSLAALCSLDLVLSELVVPENLHLYTFGEARVGNKVFADTMDRFVVNSYRVVHYADIVPHLPPRDLVVMDFLHHSEEIWYNEASTSYKACGVNENPEHGPIDCMDSLSPLKWNIPDHKLYLNYKIADSCS
jgi:predicted lipase